MTETLLLRSATLPGADGPTDILLRDGLVAAIGAAPDHAGPVHECDGGLVLPAFVDMHTHLDKGHVWPRRANPDGTFMGALLAVKDDRERHWSEADVEARMEFALRCAYAHGTAAIRTHLDSVPPQHGVTWPLFERMRTRWAGRVDLQGVALIGPDQLVDPGLVDEVAAVAKAAGGRLGGAVSVFDRAAEAVRGAVEVAGRHGLDLDLHIDESGDTAARSLRHLADTVLETGFPGRVVAGHCCSLAVHDEAFAAETIKRVARAGIAVVSLPMCNMYLQDRRPGRTPRWRGVTLVQELAAAGVPVSFASDNTRDPFYAYGDLDALEVFREAVRTCHLDHPADGAWRWLDAVTATPAEVCGFAGAGRVAVGAPADLVVVRARTWTELLSRPQHDRVVIRGGQRIDAVPPDYRDLDALFA